MILDLPGFDKITNKITFGLIRCFNERKEMKPLTNQPVRFLIEGSLSPKKKQPVVFYNRVLTVRIKTENAEVTATHQ